MYVADMLTQNGHSNYHRSLQHIFTGLSVTALSLPRPGHYVQQCK